jgi:hypothetical protein
MAVAWRKRHRSRWLIVAAGAPTAYYAFRTAVLFDFVPLARFGVTGMSLLLPFMVSGWSWLRAERGATTARRVAVGSAMLAVLTPLALGVYTLHNDSPTATVLKSISPAATNPRHLMRAADYVRTTVVEPGRTLALDTDEAYQDLQLAFFARVATERTTRMSWPGFCERVRRTPPDVVVVFSGGRLLTEDWVTLRNGSLMLGSVSYREVQRFDPTVVVYARADVQVEKTP